MIERGTKFFWKGDYAKVMACADGYVMARKSGGVPFVIYEKHLVSSTNLTSVLTSEKTESERNVVPEAGIEPATKGL